MGTWGEVSGTQTVWILAAQLTWPVLSWLLSRKVAAWVTINFFFSLSICKTFCSFSDHTQIFPARRTSKDVFYWNLSILTRKKGCTKRGKERKLLKQITETDIQRSDRLWQVCLWDKEKDKEDSRRRQAPAQNYDGGAFTANCMIHGVLRLCFSTGLYQHLNFKHVSMHLTTVHKVR
jgi:hypothetical protein